MVTTILPGQQAASPPSPPGKPSANANQGNPSEKPSVNANQASQPEKPSVNASPTSQLKKPSVNANQTTQPRKVKKPKVSLTRPVIIALCITGFVLVCVFLFSWNRWLRFNDAQDFCGEWYANDTSKVVTATATEINLTTAEAYSYTLDTGAKTITFTFGNMQGKARYRFSNNRQVLEIVDGTSFTFWGNLFDDTVYDLKQLLHAMRGESEDVPQSGNGTVVLKRSNG